MTGKARWIKVVTLLFVLGCALFSSSTKADIETIYSLEWLVASHDYVVDGIVSDRRAIPGQRDQFFLTLKTSGLRLKGSIAESFTAVIFGTKPTVGQRVIVFSKTEYAASSCGRDPKTGKLEFFPRQHITRFLDGSNHWFLPSRDFERIEGIDALEKRIRLVARGPVARRSIRLPVPPSSELGAGRITNAPVLVVPRDAASESYLHKLIGSKLPDDRTLGVVLLKEYESVANIRLLLSLRNDPATVLVDGEMFYPVRDAANHVLEIWEVPLQ
ncbi:MAG: hypothetical protein JRF33_22975 [Deltaproteobacteria bacterium]|nr:hypothetical protein [Deltaproteobacteria bacterium]